MTNTENPEYLPLNEVSEDDYFIVAQEDPRIDWHYNEDIDHPHDWKGYIRVDESGIHTFSAAIDDNAYIKINGQKVVELTGTHAQTNVSGSIELEAGYHWVELHHENGAGPLVQAGAANAEVFIPKMDGKDLKLYTVVEKKSLHYPVRFDVTFTSTSSVLPSQKNLETQGTYAASGQVFNGTMIVTYKDGKTMSIPVQTGGWMANNSPWLNGTAKDSEGNEILPPPSTGAYEPGDYPDTACPTTVTKMRTPFRELQSGVKGYEIINGSGAGANHPDSQRSGLYLHVAKRIGSEGCISTFDYVKWGMLKGDMRLANTKEDIPALSVSYVGVTRDALRQPAK